MNDNLLKAIAILGELVEYDPDANPEYYKGGKEVILDMLAPGDDRDIYDVLIDGYMREMNRLGF